MIRRAICALTLLLATGGGSLADGWFSAPVSATGAAMKFEPPEDGPLVFRGAVAIHPPFEQFGGLSGAVFTGPDDVLAVSDKGDWMRFRLVTEKGRLTGLADVSFAHMLHSDGTRMNKGARNAEGIAIDPLTGGVWVSYEGYNRIYGFDAPGAPYRERIIFDEWRRWGDPGGLEGLAAAPNGELWAVREEAEEGAFPIFVGRAKQKAWRRLRLPARGPYLPTGADFGPDGEWLYVTERAFSFIGGFRFRLRRLKWAEGPEPAAEETLLEFGSETKIDNIESVTLWREAGRTRLLLMSDDNFLPVQRNVFALFELKE